MSQPAQDRIQTSAALARLAGRYRSALIGVAVLSGAVNVLYLTSSFFMLEVYDRVIPSRSMPTLVGLCLIAGLLYVFHGLFDVLRSRILSRIASSIDATLSPEVFRLLGRLKLSGQAQADGLGPLRDLEAIRAFVSSTGPCAFFDLPWIPLYLAICWAFHPLIGIATLLGCVVLFALTIVSEVLSRRTALRANESAGQRAGLAETVRRNADVVQALGIGPAMQQRWAAHNATHRMVQQRSADMLATLGGISKILRMGLQSAVLAIGAWLVIEQTASSGVIIAASILSSRALAPVELAIANWRGFVTARLARRRLAGLMAALADPRPPTLLPPPEQALAVEQLWVSPPGQQRMVLRDISFTLESGQALGIIGPSGSGKSSLAKALVGVWLPQRGKVRLDRAALDQWDPAELGRHLGYVPQDVELFPGTIAENIGRFAPTAQPADLVRAARAAGVHDLILSLPQGYDTRIGDGGVALSAGQRQRVALARALYGDPFLVVLDEPNSNLDAEGDAALTQAIAGVKARGGIVIVVAHRPSGLAGVELLLALADGQTVAFGPQAEVAGRVLRPTPVAREEAPVPRRAASKKPALPAEGRA